MKTQLPSVKQSREIMLQLFGINFTCISNEIFSPIQMTGTENIFSVIRNAEPMCRRFMIDRKTGAAIASLTVCCAPCDEKCIRHLDLIFVWEQHLHIQIE